MNILFLVSKRAKISELKKLTTIIDNLIIKEYNIYLVDDLLENQEARFYLQQKSYNYQNVTLKDLENSVVLINDYQINKIIVLGLNYYDSLSHYLEHFIGTNIDLYLIIPTFGSKSDASFFINQGAYLYNHIDDLNN